jgi:glycosyltransferase involved in cell wall biosynthesis
MRSVLDQAYPALEYVVMDGGSTDGSVEILRRYENRLAGWVSERDGGQYAAVANGIARTKGEIIGWLNSDDAYVPGALSVVGEIFAHFPEVEWLTTLCPLFWDREGRAVHAEAIAGYSAGAFHDGEHLPQGEGFALGYIQQESTFWRRSLWERAGGFDPDFPLAGDFALWARFFQHAPLCGITAPLGGFRVHGDQKTGRAFQKYSDEAEAVLGKYCHGRSTRLWGKVRELAIRTPAFCWPALNRFGLVHRAKTITFDRAAQEWVMREVFV